MIAIKEFKKYFEVDYKNYKKQCLGKNVEESSNIYFADCSKKYKEYSREELDNLINYINDLIWYKSMSVETSYELSKMDYRIINIIPQFFTLIIAILTAIVSVVVAYMQKAESVGTGSFEVLIDSLLDIYTVVGISIIPLTIIIFLVGIIDYVSRKNRAIKIRFLKGIKAEIEKF